MASGPGDTEAASPGEGAVDLQIPGLGPALPLGQGGFGTVYRAAQPEFDRTVAVKVLAVQTLDGDARRRFEREVRSMGSLSGHPNVVAVISAGFTPEGRPYLVMEDMSRGSLGDELRRVTRMAWRPVAEAGIAVADALSAAHRASILHRDVKPENILVSRYGTVKLADFGIARLLDGVETYTAIPVLTVAHSAPEILSGDQASTSSDVYALGSTLATLLLGHPPFRRETGEVLATLLARIVRDPPPDLRPLGVPEQMCRIIEACLGKSPSQRPDLDTVRRELTAALSVTSSGTEQSSGAAAASRTQPVTPSAPRQWGSPPAPSMTLGARQVVGPISEPQGHSGPPPYGPPPYGPPPYAGPPTVQAPPAHPGRPMPTYSAPAIGDGLRYGQRPRQRPRAIVAVAAVAVAAVASVVVLTSRAGSGSHPTPTPTASQALAGSDGRLSPPRAGRYNFSIKEGGTEQFSVSDQGTTNGQAHLFLFIASPTGTQSQDAIYKSDGVFIDNTIFADPSNAGATLDCRWAQPYLDTRSPLVVGDSWSTDASCPLTIQGKSAQLRYQFTTHVTGTKVDSVGGTNVAVFTASIDSIQTSTVDGQDVSQTTVSQTSEYAPGAGLTIHADIHGSSTTPQGTTPITQTLDLQSLTPQ